VQLTCYGKFFIMWWHILELWSCVVVPSLASCTLLQDSFLHT
jgi:ABC-type microcin C transport system permease subunit YejB